MPLPISQWPEKHGSVEGLADPVSVTVIDLAGGCPYRFERISFLNHHDEGLPKVNNSVNACSSLHSLLAALLQFWLELSV